MSTHLPIPDDFQHLIEKRDREIDRRDEKCDRRQLDMGPVGAIKKAETIEGVPTEDRRNNGRRAQRRREEDRSGGTP